MRCQSEYSLCRTKFPLPGEIYKMTEELSGECQNSVPVSILFLFWLKHEISEFRIWVKSDCTGTCIISRKKAQ